MDKRLKAFERLLNIMDDLREQCPWDKRQTFESLRPLTLEETYELSDAILEEDDREIQAELGDLIMHIVFYSKIAEEKDAFDISDVLQGICDKLVHRHPHIYSDTIVKDEEEVKRNWEELKLKEGRTSVLEGVPPSLPSLLKAVRIQEKVRGIGFDWEHSEQVWDKVKEELDELHTEIESDTKNIEEEFGDVLFSLINYARFININPETALEKTNKKFIKRFQKMENLILQENLTLSEMNLKEMDVFWEKAKTIVG